MKRRTKIIIRLIKMKRNTCLLRDYWDGTQKNQSGTFVISNFLSFFLSFSFICYYITTIFLTKFSRQRNFCSTMHHFTLFFSLSTDLHTLFYHYQISHSNLLNYDFRYQNAHLEGKGKQQAS